MNKTTNSKNSCKVNELFLIIQEHFDDNITHVVPVSLRDPFIDHSGFIISAPSHSCIKPLYVRELDNTFINSLNCLSRELLDGFEGD